VGAAGHAESQPLRAGRAPDRSSTALSTLKTPVLAPIAMASTAIAKRVCAGRWRHRRSA
jgi:hypothetical protein